MTLTANIHSTAEMEQAALELAKTYASPRAPELSDKDLALLDNITRNQGNPPVFLKKLLDQPRAAQHYARTNFLERAYIANPEFREGYAPEQNYCPARDITKQAYQNLLSGYVMEVAQKHGIAFEQKPDFFPATKSAAR